MTCRATAVRAAGGGGGDAAAAVGPTATLPGRATRLTTHNPDPRHPLLNPAAEPITSDSDDDGGGGGGDGDGGVGTDGDAQELEDTSLHSFDGHTGEVGGGWGGDVVGGRPARR